MKGNDFQSYTIIPLDTAHTDELCEDIREQYESGVAACALFMMSLVPEGNPVVNKAEILCRRYASFREKLCAMGVPNGVLVQASIGHGWSLNEMFPYQRYVNFIDGGEENTVCPYDEGFKEYIYNAMRTIALCNPDHIMLDDDFRLMFRGGKGCACPLHMKRFNELAGTSLSRQELWDIVSADTPLSKKYTDIFVETQRESLLDTARVMRNGIDSVNPALPGSFCCVGSNAEFGAPIAEIMAGEGNPVVIRINNGHYAAEGTRYFSSAFFRAAEQIAKIRQSADVILAETDTCPQNRYSTGAMSLHTHFVGSILEGVNGAKHWITRLNSFEPESGRAYRRVLSENSGLYRELARIVPSLRPRGCRIPLSDKAAYAFGKNDVSGGMNGWGRCVLERLGLPMYFSQQAGGALCLDGALDPNWSDAEIKKALSGTAFLASDSARELIRRGYAEYIGVDVREWHGASTSFERLSVNGEKTSCQQNTMELVPTAHGTVEDSTVCHTVDGQTVERLFPGTVVYKNSLGGKICTFCGTPRANFDIGKIFSFLNYSRKQQLIRLLSDTDDLPIYYPGDEEIYLRAADMPDGTLLCAVFNLGFDPIDKLTLVCKLDAGKIEKLMPDGSYKAVSFEREGDKYTADTPCHTLDPVVLLIR